MIYRSFSSDETKRFGELLAQKIVKQTSLIAKRRRALVIAFQGNLGAGKTTFTQGFFKGLGIRRRAISPTFVIMRRYAVPSRRGVNRKIGFTDIFHFDAYRLKKAEDVEVLDFENILSSPQHIVLVEWPERIVEALPPGTIFMKFAYGKKENERRITVKTSLFMSQDKKKIPF